METCRDERVQIVQERDVADDQHDGPDVRRRGAQRRGHHSIDAVRAPVGQWPDRPTVAGQPVVHVADRHAVAGPQERPVGQEGAQDCEWEALEGLAACLDTVQPRGEGVIRRAIGLAPGSCPGAVGRPRASGQLVRESVRGGGRVGLDERGRDDRRVAPHPVRVDHHLIGPRALEEGQHRLRCRRRAETDDEVGQVGVAPRAGANQVVGMGQNE